VDGKIDAAYASLCVTGILSQTNMQSNSSTRTVRGTGGAPTWFFLIILILMLPLFLWLLKFERELLADAIAKRLRAKHPPGIPYTDVLL
jgi:hypothetical protein